MSGLHSVANWQQLPRQFRGANQATGVSPAILPVVGAVVVEARMALAIQALVPDLGKGCSHLDEGSPAPLNPGLAVGQGGLLLLGQRRQHLRGTGGCGVLLNDRDAVASCGLGLAILRGGFHVERKGRWPSKWKVGGPGLVVGAMSICLAFSGVVGGLFAFSGRVVQSGRATGSGTDVTRR